MAEKLGISSTDLFKKIFFLQGFSDFFSIKRSTGSGYSRFPQQAAGLYSSQMKQVHQRLLVHTLHTTQWFPFTGIKSRRYIQRCY